MPELILVRHVATDLAGRFCGQSDPAINALGRAQLDELLVLLRTWKVDSVYSSDLQRARQTAEAISAEFSVPLQMRRGLREISFGEWESLSWDEIEELIDATAHAALPNRILEGRPRRQTPGREVGGRPEERARGAIENAEWQAGLKRHDAGDGPPRGQGAQRPSVTTWRLRQHVASELPAPSYAVTFQVYLPVD